MVNEKIKSFFLFQNFNNVRILFSILLHNNLGYRYLSVSQPMNLRACVMCSIYLFKYNELLQIIFPHLLFFSHGIEVVVHIFAIF